MASNHEYHIAAEKDISTKANRHIWYYFIALGVMLYLTIIGLDIMYRFQVQYEREIKIGVVKTAESQAEIERSNSYLSGSKGLFENKRHVPIEEAMDLFVNDLRRAR